MFASCDLLTFSNLIAEWSIPIVEIWHMNFQYDLDIHFLKSIKHHSSIKTFIFPSTKYI